MTMERVGPEDHPLSTSIDHGYTYDYNRGRRGSSYSDPSSTTSDGGGQHIRSPTASLIQSAARSILDDATPSTIFSDNEQYDDEGESDSGSCADGVLGGLRSLSTRHILNSAIDNNVPSPTLSSLQIKTAPALPSEQNRRRFIGCMAAILASAYDYDDEQESQLSETNSIARSAANSAGATSSSFVDQLYYEDEDNYLDTSVDNIDVDDEDPTSQQPSSSSVSESDYALHAGTSFESDYSSYTSSSSHHPQQYLHAQKQEQRQQTRISIKSMSTKERIRWSSQRHRRRRYDIMCKLLVDSAELLLLDKSVAKGFLPMLEQLLVPQKTTKTSQRTTVSSKRGNSHNSPSKSDPNYPPPPLYGASRRGGTSSVNSTMKTTTSSTSPIKSKAELASQQSSNMLDIVTDDYRDNDMEGPAAKEYRPEDIDKENLLKPFLESLEPGSGFRCLSLLLLQHLLTSREGYDSRIRHVFKKIGVIVLMHDMDLDPIEDELLPPPVDSGGNSSKTNRRKNRMGSANNERRRPYPEMASYATRKWEALEHSIARRLIRLSESSTTNPTGDKNGTSVREKRIVMGKGNNNNKGGNTTGGITSDQIVRGLKIGSAGLVAGTLFAVTGGFAAAGIAAGVSAFAGAAAGTAAVVTLTSPVVVTTIFGVGGGSLAAYKMQRRTQGLTEFEFQKETNVSSENDDDDGNLIEANQGGNERRTPATSNSKPGIEAELFSTICISGWLRDEYDFQRPWGLHPTSPRLDDRVELLERFYSIHSPDHVPKCRKILKRWQGEEDQLWAILREKYGTDPDHLFPLQNGQRSKGALTLEQEEILDKIFVELGYNSEAPDRPKPAQRQSTPFERMKQGWEGLRNKTGSEGAAAFSSSSSHATLRGLDSLHGPGPHPIQQSFSSHQGSFMHMDSSFSKEEKESDSDKVDKAPQHLATVWDYKTTYGGELYTIRWESELIQKICDCVMDMAMDVVGGATKQILKQTILSTLLTAVVWPSYLLNVANMIDGDWTLAVERAEQAGKELAKTLLFSRAGHRPVTLIGFSFGARLIYCCLKELARLQDRWEEYQDLRREEANRKYVDRTRMNKLEKEFEGMREPASVVEDAILMGLPNHLSLVSWKGCRQVVGGRLVNCYSTNDLILSLMFQAKRFSGGSLDHGVGGFFLKPVCGTCAVKELGVENIDVSDLVSGHQDYCLVTGKILERVHHGQPLRYSSVPVNTPQTEWPQHARTLVY